MLLTVFAAQSCYRLGFLAWLGLSCSLVFGSSSLNAALLVARCADRSMRHAMTVLPQPQALNDGSCNHERHCSRQA